MLIILTCRSMRIISTHIYQLKALKTTVNLFVQDDKPSIACERCTFISKDKTEFELHKQTSHMTTKVDLNVEDQNVIVCEQCDYVCKYKILLKKASAEYA